MCRNNKTAPGRRFSLLYCIMAGLAGSVEMCLARSADRWCRGHAVPGAWCRAGQIRRRPGTAGGKDGGRARWTVGGHGARGARGRPDPAKKGKKKGTDGKTEAGALSVLSDSDGTPWGPWVLPGGGPKSRGCGEPKKRVLSDPLFWGCSLRSPVNINKKRHGRL